MKIIFCITLLCSIALSPVTVLGDESFPITNFLPAIISGKSLPPFTRSASGKIVTDTTTHLIWQDFRVEGQDNKAAARTHCANKTLDGYDDWRFPTFDELQFFFRTVAATPGFDLYNWGSFPGCIACMTEGGYVMTPYGADYYTAKYPGEFKTGDDAYTFGGRAAVHCVHD